MSSRIIVKNLPKRYTEERLKEHFSQKGTVTDSRIIYNSETGESRKFGFVGYSTEKEAKRAVKYFNGTFIDTSKVTVEIAKSREDAILDQPRSKITRRKIQEEEEKVKRKEQERLKKEAKEKEGENEENGNEIEGTQLKEENVVKTLYEETVEKYARDPRFQEFLAVMGGRAKSKSWGNDESYNEIEKKVIMKAIKAKKNTKVEQVKSKKMGGENLKLVKTHLKFDDEEETSVNTEEKKDDKEVEVEFEEDMEWLKKHMKVGKEDVDTKGENVGKEKKENDEVKGQNGEKEGQGEGEGEGGKSDEKESEDEGDNREREADIRRRNKGEILDNGRLYVRNLSYLVTEEDITKLFGRYGPITEVHMPIDKETKQMKGYCYVMYVMPEHAVKAYIALDRKPFMGRILHIIPAKDKKEKKEEDGGDDNENKSYKSKLQKKLKEMSSNEFNWNSLYMSADAIAESISERLKIDKSDILMNKAAGGGMNDDNDGDEADGSERAKGGMSAAVKLAIAETHIVESSKKYFEDNGIELKNFQNSKNKKRSNKVILVKNIGFNKNTEEQVEAIRDMFSAHGSLGRVLVPPMAGTIAIVEFLESNEAKSAFKYLAYKRVGDKPLYLEWAPENLFSHEYTPVGKAAGQKSSEDADAEAGNVDNSKNDDDNDMADAASNVIFIKNINFDSKKSTIEKLFKPFDGFQAISIRKGFGFAEFSNPKVAKRALKKLSKEELKIDGHKLQLQLSKTSNTKNNEDAKEETDNEKAISNRLIVKNIPFEATKKDITQLFQTFGQLKKVRLPKRPSYNSSNSSGYTHRGFAFLEFLTKNEALKAFNSTSDSTHLYGRRLVVEWTTAEGENENQMDIDANDKVDFQTEDAHINKKLKIKD